MRQLTLEQKLEAYKWVKENFRTHPNGPYVCNLLGIYIQVDPYFGRHQTESAFPEFFKRKPSTQYLAWFLTDDVGNSQREALLGECIKECEEKLIEVNL